VGLTRFARSVGLTRFARSVGLAPPALGRKNSSAHRAAESREAYVRLQAHTDREVQVLSGHTLSGP
jgi:hypothetical protein